MVKEGKAEGQVEEFLTTVAVARLARVSREAVRRWVMQQLLPAQRTTTGIHLFRREDVMRLLHERRERALARYSIPSEG